MASEVVDRAKTRDHIRWWEWLPARRLALEGVSLQADRTIRRLSGAEIDRNRDLRALVDRLSVEPDDLLVYLAHAEGRFGRYRLAVICPYPPDILMPRVFCLDGPRGTDASEHRNSEVELCLFYKDDPTERRWTPDDGLGRLFDLARRHVTGEYIYRETGSWPFEEAPHGETEPAPRDMSLALERVRKPGRNEPCPCGSGRKSKRCCFR